MSKDLEEGSDDDSEVEKRQEEVPAERVRTAQRVVG